MRRVTLVAALLVGTVSAGLVTGARQLRAAQATATSARTNALTDKAVLLRRRRAAAGLVAKYAEQGVMPTMGRSSGEGTSASGNGLLTQAPPNTGAGWYTLATGAWPGVHGSTNNTFHINGQPFANRTAAFDAGRAPGRVDRPVRRARRAQGRPGRVGRRPQRDDPGPDDRLPVVLLRPRRRDELHRQGRRPAVRRRPVHHSRSGSSSTIRPATPGQAPFPGAAPTPATGWTGSLPRTYSPAMEMRLRVLDFGVDKYGAERLHLRLDERPADELRPRALLDGRRAPPTRSAILREGQWADVKVKIDGGALGGPDRRACSSGSRS